MLELEQLIQKFWANQTTKAENKRLLELLEQHQAMMENTMMENKAPDDYFHEHEDYLGHTLQPDKAMSILQKLHGQLGIEDIQHEQKRGAVVRKLVPRVAVAAAIVVTAVSIFLLTVGRHTDKPAVAAATSAQNPHLVTLSNSADSALTLNLEDGSTVRLEKNSSLRYYKPFINDRRDISLIGIALFKVAKDKKRPFTVYAGGIATTALGTRFLVNATDSKKVMVKLLDGKVVIKTAAGSNLAMKDVYLSPGEQFSFDKDSRQYTVNRSHDKPEITATPIRPVATPNETPELVFRKEPLGKVFEKVSELYKVPLIFRKEDMNGLYFTGTFLHSDNLNIVLSTICNVNDLLVTKNGDTITITRSHQ